MFQPRGPYVQRSWHHDKFGTAILCWKRPRTDIEYMSCWNIWNQKENLDIAEGEERHAWDGKSRGDQTVCLCRKEVLYKEVPRELVANAIYSNVTKRMQRYAKCSSWIDAWKKHSPKSIFLAQNSAKVRQHNSKSPETLHSTADCSCRKSERPKAEALWHHYDIITEAFKFHLKPKKNHSGATGYALAAAKKQARQFPEGVLALRILRAGFSKPAAGNGYRSIHISCNMLQ